MANKLIDKPILFSFTIIVLLSVLYVFALTVVFIPPNAAIEKRVNGSIEQIEREGLYPRVGSYRGAHLDNFTDRVMYRTTLRNSNNPLKAALEMNGYHRYWHGYITFLRPLSLFVGYNNIRYLNIFVIFTLFFMSAYFLAKRLNFMSAIAYIISLCMVHVYIFPLSMQYSSVFIIMMISVIVICKISNNVKPNILFYFFVIIGSLTNFFDFLTAPITTLVYPAAIAFFIFQRQEKQSTLQIIKNSTAWFMGYAGTWIAKWIIVWAALGLSPLQTAYGAIKFRLFGGKLGETEYVLNRFGMFLSNGRNMFPNLAILLGILIIIAWFVWFLKNQRHNKNALKILPVLMLCLYPYIWYFILANHSQIHAGFTYRAQAGAVFTALLFLIYSLDINPSNIPGFIKKYKKTTREFLGYFIIGITAFIIDTFVFAVFNAVLSNFNRFGLYLSAFIAFVVAFAANYLLSSKYVFIGEQYIKAQKTKRVLVLFVLISIIGLGLTGIGMYLGVDVFQSHALSVKIVVSFIVLFWNFGARKICLNRIGRKY
jgi:putative flippase GtrA